MEKTTVLLADDHTILRQGLRALLQAEKRITVVGEAGNGKLAVQLARSLKPDVVVMDIGMPILNGAEATRQIKKENPAIKILILSMYSDDEFVHRAIQAGASGYLIKQTAANDLLTAIDEVVRGNVFFSPSISRIVVERYRDAIRRGITIERRGAILTPRELEVLQLIAEGETNKEVAVELTISVKTVEKHRQQIYKKLQLRDAAGVTRYAISNGIIEGKYRGT